ncbi:MAG: helix-turn-helix transcriptional regulator [Kiritimatiellae bacterium]|nr:helix-turn-helix transcriptional regulator [Kiritimatiellia bacterium]
MKLLLRYTMLALVKKPRIELSLQGENVSELLDWIKQKYDVSVLSEKSESEFVSVESTAYWKKMEKNRVGNLLSGSRLKAGLTQAQLAAKLGIQQNMVSDYERGRRTYSDAMAKRLSETLNVNEEHLRYGNEQYPTGNIQPNKEACRGPNRK